MQMKIMKRISPDLSSKTSREMRQLSSKRRESRTRRAKLCVAVVASGHDTHDDHLVDDDTAVDKNDTDDMMHLLSGIAR